MTEPNRRPRSRLREWGGRLLLLFGSLMLSLVLGEIVIRLVRPQQLRRPVQMYRPLDSLGAGFLPDLHIAVSGDERTVDLHTDRDGYRVGAGGRLEADTRVLILGDSFMEGLQVQYEQSLPGLLESRLPQQVGQAVAVRNAGIAGYSPSHYLIAAGRAAGRERFSAAVVALFDGNDLVGKRQAYFGPAGRKPVGLKNIRLPRAWNRPEIFYSTIYPTVQIIKRYSHLVNLAWNGSELFRMRVGLWGGHFPWIYNRAESSAPHFDVTADICADIQRVLGAAGTPVIFLVIPAYAEMDPAQFARYARAGGRDTAELDIDQPMRRLVEELEERQLVTISALPALRAAYQAGEDVYGDVDRHLEPTGHRILADLIEPKLMELLGRAPGSPRS